MATHPIQQAIVNGVKVGKSGVREYFERRLPLGLFNASEIQSLELSSSQTTEVRLAGQTFIYDPADTTTAHDGTTVLVSQDGRRYKILTSGLANSDGLTEGATNRYYTAAREASAKDRAEHTGTQAISTVTGLQSALDSKLASSEKGAANGVAALDSGGKVPAGQLPSYVDDVLEYANLAAFPLTGEAGKIYIAIDTGWQYRWGGSAYTRIVQSPGSTDDVTEGAGNLYHTSARVRATLLDGFSASPNSAVGAGDSVLAAIGKLQAQVSDRMPLSGGFFGGQIVAPVGYFGTLGSANGVIGLFSIGANTFIQGYQPDNFGVLRDIYVNYYGGSLFVPTPAPTDDSQRAASTAWVRAYLTSVSSGTVSVVGFSGTVTLENLVTGGLAPNANPVFSGSIGLGTASPKKRIHVDGAAAPTGESVETIRASKDDDYGVDISGGIIQGTGAVARAELVQDGVNTEIWRRVNNGNFQVSHRALGLSDVLTVNTTGVWYAVLWGVNASNDAATNTTALNALTAAVVAAGGGKIILPRGTIQHNNLNAISGGNCLVIEGQGKFQGGTVLQCMSATGIPYDFSGGSHPGLVNCYLTAGVRRTSGFTCRFRDGAFHPVFDCRIDYHFDGVIVDGGSEATVFAVMRYMYGASGVLFTGSAGARMFGGNARLAADNPYPVNGDGARKTYANGLAVNAGEILWCPGTGFIYQVMVSGNLGASEPNTIGGTGAADGWSTNITSGTAQLRFVSRVMNWIEIANYAYSIRLFQGTHLLNGYRGVITTDAANTADSRPKWIYLNFTETDHTLWHGVEAFRGESIYLCNGWFGSSLLGRGVMVDTGFAKDVMLDAGTRIAGNWLDGFYCGANVRNVRAIGPTIEDNSQAGIGAFHGAHFDGTQRWSMVAAYSAGARQGYGLLANTGTDYFAAIGNHLGGNATAPLQIVPGTAANRREVQMNIN